MAAAEAVHAAEHRAHQIDGPGVVAAAVRGHRGADGQRVIAHQRRIGGVSCREVAHGRQHPLRRGLPAGRGQRHHQVRQGEAGDAVADPRLRLVRQFHPALPHIDALARQPEQHGGGVLQVDVEVRHRLHQRRSQVAEAFVVQGQHPGGLATFEVVHRGMPVQMVHQVVRAVPIARQAVNPGDALAPSPLHLQHVSDAVRGPEVAGIARDRLPPGRLGLGVMAAFLHREAAAAQQRAVAGHVAGPVLFGGQHRCQHPVRPAEPEIDEMGEAEGQDVVRMVEQDLVPDRRCPVRSAAGPGVEGREVRLLARRGAGAERAGGIGRRLGDRHHRLLVGQHGEQALQQMRERHLRIGGEQRLHSCLHVRAVAEIAGDHAVERGNRLRGGGGDRVSLCIMSHGARLP